MPAYAIGEKAADLIKGVILNLGVQGIRVNEEGVKANETDFNGNGTLVLN
jgi:hypothetical protein